ncbi:NXPE family member 4-like [Apostichopus japonicus]|uniref:NXPE family member 4-like n=1 Tax=Stichopus japonicus TaxID=307972 RepID=UPI003AB71BB8
MNIRKTHSTVFGLIVVCVFLLKIVYNELSDGIALFDTNSTAATVLQPPKIASAYTFEPKAHHPVACSPDVPDRFNFQPIRSTNRVPMKTLPFDNVTSPNFTKVTLINPKLRYGLCDRIIIRIEAMDNLNRPKLYGEDFFRIKLFSRVPYAAVIADKFVDYRNGTYLASFPLLWEGLMNIEVLLVHPAEAIPLFSPSLDGQRSYAHNYVGEFEMIDDAGVKRAENVDCSERPPKTTFCNFSDPEVYSPFYCNVPKDKNLTCRHWVAFHQDKIKLLSDLTSEIRGDEVKILEVTRKVVQHGIRPILVNDEVDSRRQTPGYVPIESLPYCKASGPPTAHPNGFIFEETWHPFNCQIAKFTHKEARDCLSDKMLRIYGDSTARQLYLNLRGKKLCYVKKSLPPSDDKKRELLCKRGNFTLYFHFHGIPNGGTKRIDNHYAAKEIDNITGGEGSNEVLLLSYWAHFAISGESYYEKRLRGVKEAINRLRKRLPGLKLIVRGTNTRDYVNQGIMLVSSDWHTQRQEMILREVFGDDASLGYLNAWDITRAQPFPDLTHPEHPIIDNLINLILTYVCLA